MKVRAPERAEGGESAVREPTRNLRSFTSVLIGASALALAASGVVLFIAPPGWLANRGWSFLRLSKSQWQALHASFAALVVAAGALHAFLNRRPLIGYFRDRANRRLVFAWPWVLAVATAALAAAGTVLEVPPFSSLREARESMKESWRPRVDVDVGPADRGPFGAGGRERRAGRGGPQGLGRMTLEAFCAGEGFDLEAALGELRKLGVEADRTTTLREVGDRLRIRPSEVPDLFGSPGEGSLR